MRLSISPVDAHECAGDSQVQRHAGAVQAGTQLLLTASTRRQEAPSGPPGGEEEDVTDGGEGVPGDIACRELVALVTNYLDGVLPSGWRAGLDRHLADCDGCTTYVEQIRAAVDALKHLSEVSVLPCQQWEP
jgi:hypothetical protein